MGYSESRFAEWMRAARTAQKMSQAEVATAITKLGVSVHTTTIAKIEAGDRAVKLDEAVAICAVLGGSLGDLFPSDNPLDVGRRLDAMEYAFAAFRSGIFAATQSLNEATDGVGAALLGADLSYWASESMEMRARLAYDVSAALSNEADKLADHARIAGEIFSLPDTALRIFATRSQGLLGATATWDEIEDAALRANLDQAGYRRSEPLDDPDA